MNIILLKILSLVQLCESMTPEGPKVFNDGRYVSVHYQCPSPDGGNNMIDVENLQYRIPELGSDAVDIDPGRIRNYGEVNLPEADLKCLEILKPDHPFMKHKHQFINRANPDQSAIYVEVIQPRQKVNEYRIRCYFLDNEAVKHHFGDYTVSGRPWDLFTFSSYLFKSKRSYGSTTADHLGALEYCFALMARRESIRSLFKKAD